MTPDHTPAAPAAPPAPDAPDALDAPPAPDAPDALAAPAVPPAPPAPPSPSRRRATAAKPKRTWIVTPAVGLHMVEAAAVDAAISNDQGRIATARDLAIAGVAAAPQED